MIHLCIWMRAGTDGKIYCDRPRIKRKRATLLCNTDFIDPEVCKWYRASKTMITRKEEKVHGIK
jgi:hypothetical protein